MKAFHILPTACLIALILLACEQKTQHVLVGDKSNNVALAASNGASAPAADMPLTTVSFAEESHNFGEIPEGDSVRHTFKFKNTGAHPLKVENVKPSCGCTSPSWSKEEIPAGGEGFVTVAFGSKGKVGVQKKSVTVTFANTDPQNKTLSFQAEVVPH